MILEDSDFAGKNILVSGAAGFIPSHLSEFYINKGAKVFGIDNFVTGSRPNIETLLKTGSFEFIEGDITEGLKDFASLKFDYIFSMASPASPLDFTTIPLEIMKTNSQGTWNLLDLAKQTGARILHASTSEIYGDPEVHPQKEDYFGNVNTLGPRACYDEAKRFSESLIMSYQRLYKVETRLIRIFNTYGPRMRPNDGRVIPNFVNQALKGETITLYGDGSQTRSFCYVSDLVRGIHDVMCSEDHFPFNVGNPDEYTIRDTAKFIVEALGSTSEIKQTRDMPEDDPKRRCPNIQKLSSVRGFKPEVTFQDGLAKTAEYFKTLIEES